MSKAISSYPKAMQPMVIQRRMRVYDPKGNNGLGTLSAKAAYDKIYEKRVKSEVAKASN